MCRKNQLHGWCILCFGLGIMVGHSLVSSLLCFCSGMGLIIFGLWVMRRR